MKGATTLRTLIEASKKDAARTGKFGRNLREEF
jgi:hypothetical protein